MGACWVWMGFGFVWRCVVGTWGELGWWGLGWGLGGVALMWSLQALQEVLGIPMSISKKAFARNMSWWKIHTGYSHELSMA